MPDSSLWDRLSSMMPYRPVITRADLERQYPRQGMEAAEERAERAAADRERERLRQQQLDSITLASAQQASQASSDSLMRAYNQMYSIPQSLFAPEEQVRRAQ